MTTDKMTTKVITDYINESTEKLRCRMCTSEAQEKYKERMPSVNQIRIQQVNYMIQTIQCNRTKKS